MYPKDPRVDKAVQQLIKGDKKRAMKLMREIVGRDAKRQTDELVLFLKFIGRIK